MDVFNSSFLEMYIKTIHDLDPGLNLLGIIQYTPQAMKAKTMHCYLRSTEKKRKKKHNANELGQNKTQKS